MLFDAHIHLLPGVGGDPITPSESYRMLDLLHESHVRGALAMSRCDPYRVHPVIYRERRDSKIGLISSYIKEHGYHIRPIYATELLYSVGIHRDFDLHEFLIPKTRYLPLLLPTEPIKDDWMRDLSHYINKMHLVPIICHFDRQYLIGNGERLANSTSLVLQITGHSLRNKEFAKFILAAMRRKCRIIIGSGADLPEVLESPYCYSSNAWGLDILQAAAHERLYARNSDFRREITFR